ncbi:MAG: AarF/UbiB family protein [Candidatus Dormiibacterota bacterium]
MSLAGQALLTLVAAMVDIVILGWAARRLLGIPFSLPRLLVAGVLALVLVNPIVFALLGGGTTRVTAPSGLWVSALGVSAALLAAMTFLALAEVFLPNRSVPGPIVWIRELPNWTGRARRYLQVTWIMTRHGLGGLLRGAPQVTEPGGEPQRRLAGSLRAALDDAGVTFVKLGQLLATRRDLLPAAYTDELARLQDRAATVPWEATERTLRAQLGSALDELVEIEREPIAAASIAQVHAARLRSGGTVVVKVRRPGVETLVARDLQILQRWADRAQRRTAWGAAIGISALAAGFARSLRDELDFRREARNLLAVAGAASARDRDDEVRIPRPAMALSTEQVLVMERLDGVPVREVPLGDDRAELARTLLTTLLEQILDDGFFHADPHAGNLLLLRDRRLGLLDFGSVGRLDRSLREGLGRVLLAIDAGDAGRLCDAVLEIVDEPAELDERRLRRALGTFLAQHLGAGAGHGGELFVDLVRLATANGLAIPGEVAAALRALATVEGVLTQLDPTFDLVAEARAYGRRRLATLWDRDRLQRSAQEELALLLPTLRALPRRLDRLAASLEQGKLTVNLRLSTGAGAQSRGEGLLHLALLTVLAATAGVMAVLLLGVRGGPSVTDQISLYAFFAYCLLIISSVLALRVLVSIFPLGHS